MLQPGCCWLRIPFSGGTYPDFPVSLKRGELVRTASVLRELLLTLIGSTTCTAACNK